MYHLYCMCIFFFILYLNYYKPLSGILYIVYSICFTWIIYCIINASTNIGINSYDKFHTIYSSPVTNLEKTYMQIELLMHENVKVKKKLWFLNHKQYPVLNCTSSVVLSCTMTSNSPPGRGLEGFSQSYPQRTWRPSSAGCLRCHAGRDCQEPDKNQQVKYMSSFSIHDCIYTEYQQIQKSMSCIMQQVHACDAICNAICNIM